MCVRVCDYDARRRRPQVVPVTNETNDDDGRTARRCGDDRPEPFARWADGGGESPDGRRRRRRGGQEDAAGRPAFVRWRVEMKKI